MARKAWKVTASFDKRWPGQHTDEVLVLAPDAASAVYRAEKAFRENHGARYVSINGVALIGEAH